MSTKQETPAGVAILALLNLIVGIFGILEGITIDFIMVGGDLTLVSSFQLGTIIVGTIQIIAGIGLYRLRSWAWILAMLVTFIGLIINIAIVTLDFTLFFEYLLAMLIRIVILAYLNKESIRTRFR